MPAFPDFVVALGVGVASGLVPVVNVEAYLVGVSLLTPGDSPWVLALAAGVGQVAGKLVYYYAARGSLRLPAFFRRYLPEIADPDAGRGSAAGRVPSPVAVRATTPADRMPEDQEREDQEREDQEREERTPPAGRPAVSIRRRMGAAVARWSARPARRIARWRARAERRPRWCMAVLGMSAFAGLPPFGVMSAIAGGIRLRVGVYLLIGIPARCARFWLLLLAPGVVTDTLGLLGLR